MATLLPLLPLLLLCSAAAAPAPADAKCVCALDAAKLPQQLVRGADAVARCDRGEYCDCQSGTVEQCESIFGTQMHYNEGEQMCDVDVDCQDYLGKTTAAPAASSTAAPPQPCACQDDKLPLRLLRGADEVAQCTAGKYCDCESKTVQTCERSLLPLIFNEETQHCDFDFDVDCQEYLEGTTPLPASTASPATAGTSTAAPTAPPTPCACQDDKLPLRLLRGADQIAQCTAGKYCDCEAKTVQTCERSLFPLIFNEESQHCDFDFAVNCEEYLEGTTVKPTNGPRTEAPTNGPRTELPTAAPTAPPTPCACQDDKLPLQLLRGADQVAQCNAGKYCDCAAKAVQQCDALPGFNVQLHFSEDGQMCDVDVNCEQYLSRTTAAPAASTASAPTPRPQACACQDDKLPLRLLRGADQIAQCNAGRYCDCKAKTVLTCERSILPLLFNEETQACVYDVDVDCEAFLQSTTTASPSTATSSAPRASSPASLSPYPTSSASQRTLSGLLYSMTAVLLVVNVVLVSRRCCARAHAAPLRLQAGGLANAVPVVYSSDFIRDRKVPLESVA